VGLVRSSGALVTVSSYAAGKQRYGIYGRVKGELEAATFEFGRRFVGHGVRANVVRPHYIEQTGNWPEPAAPTAATIPLRRYGLPREVAAMVVALARNRYVTGQTVAVDGGVSFMEGR
jgi:3-oxoacyl-[acyl-carrier protein] reductase